MSEKTDNKVPNVPNLRFGSSTSTWELTPITTLISECLETTSNFEKYPLYSFTIEEGVVPKSERYERSFLVKKDGDSFKVVKHNNFVMNPMNLRFGAISYSKIRKDVSVSGYYNIFNIDNGQCNDYWEALFRRTKTLKLYDSVATGSLLEKKRVHFSQFRNLKFYIPEHTERLKISLFFSKINERIETQSKIIEEYISYKKIILDKLIFNNKHLSKVLPLSEFAKLKNGYAFKSDSYVDNGEYKVITIANVSGKRYIDMSIGNTVSKIPNDLQNHQILKPNDILISLTGNVGRVSIVKEDHCLLNQRVGVLSFSGLQLKNYIYQVLSSKRFESNMILKGQGAAQKNIGNDDVESFLIPIIDDLSYIEKITALLECIDERITIENKLFEKLKEQKKFLLSNMFI